MRAQSLFVVAASFFVLSGAAGAATISQTGVFLGAATPQTDSGSTSSSLAYDASNLASARVDRTPGAVVSLGVELRTDVNPTRRRDGDATAFFQDEWASTGQSVCAPVVSANFCPVHGNIHLSGTVGSDLGNGNVSFLYSLEAGWSDGSRSSHEFSFSIGNNGFVTATECTIAGCNAVPLTMIANANGTFSLSQDIALGQLARPAGQTGYLVSLTESMRLRAEVDASSSGPPTLVDFFHTISVSLEADDPSVQLVSSSGRTLVSVPEPGTLLSLGAGLALLGLRRRIRP